MYKNDSSDCSSNDFDTLIHIPKGFRDTINNLLENNPIEKPRVKNTALQAEYALFYLNHLYKKQKSFHGEDQNQFVPLHSDNIRKYEGSGTQFTRWLCDRGILESTSYLVGLHSRQYRFAEDHSFEGVHLSNPTLIQKIAAARVERVKEIQADPIRSKLFRRTSGVVLLPEADEWVRTQGYPEARERAILDNIALARGKDLNRGYFMAQGFKSGRIFTPHSHLPKEVRNRFLLIDGEEPAELDLKCSQFQILYLVFKDKSFPTDRWGILQAEFQSELKRYVKCFQEGGKDLYSILAESQGLSREQLKKKIIPWLFSSEWQMRSFSNFVEMSRLFESNFPLLYSLIQGFKGSEFHSMAGELQKIESNAIIKDIAVGKLYEEGFSFITVHDSVIVPKSKFEYVKNTIWEPLLKERGFPEFLNGVENPLEVPSEPVEETSEFENYLFG